MMPPRCHVCGLSLRDVNLPEDQHLSSAFTLVSFALSQEGQATQDRLGQEGWTGHRPNDVWFCNPHAELGLTRAQMHWRDALDDINAATD